MNPQDFFFFLDYFRGSLRDHNMRQYFNITSFYIGRSTASIRVQCNTFFDARKISSFAKKEFPGAVIEISKTTYFNVRIYV